MSHHVCPQCGHLSHVFGRDGAGKLATEMCLEVLGECDYYTAISHLIPRPPQYFWSIISCAGDVPLDEAIREGSDRGLPVVAAQPDSPLTAAYLKIASRLLDTLPKVEDPLVPR